IKEEKKPAETPASPPPPLSAVPGGFLKQLVRDSEKETKLKEPEVREERAQLADSGGEREHSSQSDHRISSQRHSVTPELHNGQSKGQEVTREPPKQQQQQQQQQQQAVRSEVDSKVRAKKIVVEESKVKRPLVEIEKQKAVTEVEKQKAVTEVKKRTEVGKLTEVEKRTEVVKLRPLRYASRSLNLLTEQSSEATQLKPDVGTPELPEGRVRVRLQSDGSLHDVTEYEIEKCNPSELELCEDLSELHYVNESVERVQAVFSILRSFGCVSSPHSDASSRFAMVLSLDFNNAGLVAGGHLQTMMLDKTELQLHQLSEFNSFGIAPATKVEEKQRASVAFNKLVVAMDTLGISAAEQKAIWHVLAGIYHIGAAGACKGSTAAATHIGLVVTTTTTTTRTTRTSITTTTRTSITTTTRTSITTTRTSITTTTRTSITTTRTSITTTTRTSITTTTRTSITTTTRTSITTTRTSITTTTRASITTTTRTSITTTTRTSITTTTRTSITTTTRTSITTTTRTSITTTRTSITTTRTPITTTIRTSSITTTITSTTTRTSVTTTQLPEVVLEDSRVQVVSLAAQDAAGRLGTVKVHKLPPAHWSKDSLTAMAAECRRTAAMPPLKVFRMVPLRWRERWLLPSKPPSPWHSGGTKDLGENRAFTTPLREEERATVQKTDLWQSSAQPAARSSPACRGFLSPGVSTTATDARKLVVTTTTTTTRTTRTSITTTTRTSITTTTRTSITTTRTSITTTTTRTSITTIRTSITTTSRTSITTNRTSITTNTRTSITTTRTSITTTTRASITTTTRTSITTITRTSITTTTRTSITTTTRTSITTTTTRTSITTTRTSITTTRTPITTTIRTSSITTTITSTTTRTSVTTTRDDGSEEFFVEAGSHALHTLSSGEPGTCRHGDSISTPTTGSSSTALSTQQLTLASVAVVDTPGLRNPRHAGEERAAGWAELCHNYLQERLLEHYHTHTFTHALERYEQ
ncbi:hypothetical protein CRUP_026111, partial [Coryphaenoides rupestris]